MGFVKDYHPDEVDLVISGRTIEGIGSNIESSSPDRVNLVEDPRGNAIWTVAKLTSADLTFELLHGAPDLDYLQDFATADLESGNGAFSVLIRNNRGQDLLTARSARLVTDPGFNMGATEAQNQTISIKMQGVKIVRGAADDTST